ncbi:MAG: hypothetical protein LBI73_14405 [Myroides sp.]|jgi:hypothetical protein|nr:hypothetical protein [Myroides sp.]
MSFKLLAIRPLEGCSKDVLKNLKEDEFYFFDNSYEQYGDTDYIRKKESGSGLPNDFFFQKNTESSLEYVNVQALVGMNGSGKSAIAELLLGTLNNIFKYVSGKIDNGIDLTYVIELKATLYFEIDGEIYIVSFSDEKSTLIKYMISENEEDMLRCIEPYLLLDELGDDGIEKIKNIFFTMYINYSLYGLDDQDFAQKRNNNYEGDKVISSLQLDGLKKAVYVSWLSKIFHKNDGYQTPLVIHPYRQNAMINVRNEKHLMENRLAALLFTNPEYRSIIPDFEFETIGFYGKSSSVGDYLKKNIKNRERKIKSITDIPLFVDNLCKWVEDNNDLLERAREVYKSNDISESYKYEMESVLYALEACRLPDSKKLVVEKIKEKLEKEYNGSILTEEEDDDFNYIRIYFNLNRFIEPERFLADLKVPSDDKIRDLLRKLDIFSIETILILVQLSVSKDRLINEFEISVEDILFNNEYEGNDYAKKFKHYLFWYSVVKSAKISEYTQYLKYRDLFEFSNIFGEKGVEVQNEYNEYLNIIFNEDKSHITEKLRRALLLLSFIKEPKTDNKGRSTNELIDYYVSVVKALFSDLFRKVEGSKLFESIDKLGGLIETVIDIDKGKSIEMIDLLPPPIFDFEFFSTTNVSFSKVSSGQFQKIGLLSSIVYHLKNLDSVKETEDIYSYENVNVVLDEIELYFHPDQQRMFVHDLLYLLKKNKFKKIKNINLMFITHSPFILSDIPSQNVLKLEKGELVIGDEINSFGANIHDLLADEFFLKDGFMGEFAKEKIEEIIKNITKVIEDSNSRESKKIKKREFEKKMKNKYHRINTKEELQIYSTIKLIGEPILRMKLEQMYEMAFRKELLALQKKNEEILMQESLDEQILKTEETLKKLKKIRDGRA